MMELGFLVAIAAISTNPASLASGNGTPIAGRGAT